mgnify:CR=1 FL=1
MPSAGARSACSILMASSTSRTAPPRTGAPAGASAEIGEQMLATLARRTGAAIGEVLDGTLPHEQWHSPFWKLRFIFVNPLAVRFFNWVMNVPRTVS